MALRDCASTRNNQLSAEAASRYPASCSLVSTKCSNELASPELAKESLIALIQSESSQFLCLHCDEIAQKTASDPSLRNLFIAVESGLDSSFLDIEIIQEYIPFRESYYIYDNVTMYHDCINCCACISQTESAFGFRSPRSISHGALSEKCCILA